MTLPHGLERQTTSNHTYENENCTGTKVILAANNLLLLQRTCCQKTMGWLIKKVIHRSTLNRFNYTQTQQNSNIMTFLDLQYDTQFCNKLKISPIFEGNNFINKLFCKARPKLTKFMGLFNCKSLPTYYKLTFIHQKPSEISMKSLMVIQPYAGSMSKTCKNMI